MNIFKVTMEGMTPSGHDDILMEFMSIDDLIPREKQFVLTTKYFQDFWKTVNEQKHYLVIPQIKKVISPAGKDLVAKYFFHIKGQYRSKEGVNFLSVLLEDDEKGNLIIRGVGSDSVSYTKKNPEYLKFFLLSASREPEKWSTVMFVGPIKEYLQR